MPLSSTSLAEAINIPAWLEQDRHTQWQTRIQRDQQISNVASIPSQQPSSRIRYWWSQIQPKTDENSSGSTVEAIFRRVAWLVMLTGFLAGIAVASALLHYDGSQPINVLVLLVVLVLLPLLLFLVSWLLPWVNSKSLISDLNIGSIMLAFLKKKSPALSDFFSSSRSDEARDKLLRWKLLLYSQQFGIALTIAALLTLLAKVSFSDLAFGWSTTLDFKAASLAPWVQVLALPWSAWLPEAVPSDHLIEQSRYFRLENGVSELSAQALTGWWKFIAMCLLVYGIGFRLITAGLAKFNYQRAIDNMLMQHSEVTALLDRFNAPPSTNKPAPVVGEKNSPFDNNSVLDSQSADILIHWNNATKNKANDEANNILKISGNDTQQSIEDALKSIDANDVNQILIITKAWEPPLLEFHDFIRLLREILSSEVSILVQPIAANNDSSHAVNVEIWRHSIEKLQDPKVYVV